jgi:hypothetical protein
VYEVDLTSPMGHSRRWTSFHLTAAIVSAKTQLRAPGEQAVIRCARTGRQLWLGLRERDQVSELFGDQDPFAV